MPGTKLQPTGSTTQATDGIDRAPNSPTGATFLFVYQSAANDGVNDFAQAADDSRAIMEFMHDFMAVEFAPPEVPEAIA